MGGAAFTTFIHFVYVLVTALVVLVPVLSQPALGGLLVVVGLGSLGHTVRTVPFLHTGYRRRVEPPR